MFTAFKIWAIMGDQVDRADRVEIAVVSWKFNTPVHFHTIKNPT